MCVILNYKLGGWSPECWQADSRGRSRVWQNIHFYCSNYVLNTQLDNDTQWYDCRMGYISFDRSTSDFNERIDLLNDLNEVKRQTICEWLVQIHLTYFYSFLLLAILYKENNMGKQLSFLTAFFVIFLRPGHKPQAKSWKLDVLGRVHQGTLQHIYLCCSSPLVSWRDIQHLLVKTSRPVHLKANDWKTNAAGHRGSYSTMDSSCTSGGWWREGWGDRHFSSTSLRCLILYGSVR